MSAQPEFDWSQAESLLGEDPANVPQDMADIVLELVQSAEERFAELEALNPETDRVAISAMAHQLRGSLLNFGYVEVGTLLYDVEKKDYASADYLGMIQKAETAFVASNKLLGERYPTLLFS
jgi:HPt (histidine-containing phosphotransfer) domain-containing protein